MCNKRGCNKEGCTVKSLVEQNQIYSKLFPQADLSGYKIPKKSSKIYFYQKTTPSEESCERKSILAPHYHLPRIKYGKPTSWNLDEFVDTSSTGCGSGSGSGVSGQFHEDDDDNQSQATFLVPRALPQAISGGNTNGVQHKKCYKPRYKLSSDKDNEISDVETLATLAPQARFPIHTDDDRDDTSTVVVGHSSSNKGAAGLVPPSTKPDNKGILNGLTNGHTKMLAELNGHFQGNHVVKGSVETSPIESVNVKGKHVPNGIFYQLLSEGNGKRDKSDDEDDLDVLMIELSEMERTELNMGFQANGDC